MTGIDPAVTHRIDLDTYKLISEHDVRCRATLNRGM